MPLDNEVIEGARKLRPNAVSYVLQNQAPGVYRIAYALTGRWESGRMIARFVLNRSILMMPKWDPEDDPANWFHRFTVQTSRRYAQIELAAGKDVLVEQAQQPDAAYVAFVAALRQLAPQQREAFLLRHGEKLNQRYSALAMDCSTDAAENHLKAAEESMRLIAGTAYDVLVRRMIDAYAHLTPDEQQLMPTVNGVVFRRVRLRRFVRAVVTLILLGVLALCAWGGWMIYRRMQS